MSNTFFQEGRKILQGRRSPPALPSGCGAAFPHQQNTPRQLTDAATAGTDAALDKNCRSTVGKVAQGNNILSLTACCAHSYGAERFFLCLNFRMSCICVIFKASLKTCNVILLHCLMLTFTRIVTEINLLESLATQSGSNDW